MLVVGIMGPLGSGKSTLAQHLVVKHDFVRVPMASILKDMLLAAGCTEEQINGSEKMDPATLLCGKTPRYAMQTLGTEWGRDIISPDIWVTCVAAKIKRLSAEHGYERFVIDDIRFPNEVEMIRFFEGSLWGVRRPLSEPPRWKQKMAIWGLPVMHPSEKWWLKINPDWVWHNSGPKGRLETNLVVADNHIRGLLKGKGMFVAPARPASG